MLARRPPALLLALLTAWGGVALATGEAAPAAAADAYDWTTYGFDLARTGHNPLETSLGRANAGDLGPDWSFDLAGVTITQPLYASGVSIGGSPRDLVLVGTEQGALYAIDADHGTQVWRRTIKTTKTARADLPGGIFGISGTPVIDRASNRVYVAAGNGYLYALNLMTGANVPGWPVRIVSTPGHDHVWGALLLVQGQLYVPTAGICDTRPFHGRIVQVDTGSPAVERIWWTTGGADGPSGGGIWGYGGLSGTAQSVYAATGNAFPEHAGYAERVVRFSLSLSIVASNYPGLSGVDVDFGTTPTLFRAPGCPIQLAALNKTGEVFIYRRDRIGHGPVQRLQVAVNGARRLLGVAAYSPVTNMLYVANPGPETGPYTSGLLALRPGGDCRWALAWQNPASTATKTTVSSPSVANGVVYYGDGRGNRVFAFDAATGDALWNSGSWIDGPVFGAPSVANGRLFVGAWGGTSGGRLYAFSPS